MGLVAAHLRCERQYPALGPYKTLHRQHKWLLVRPHRSPGLCYLQSQVFPGLCFPTRPSSEGQGHRISPTNSEGASTFASVSRSTGLLKKGVIPAFHNPILIIGSSEPPSRREPQPPARPHPVSRPRPPPRAQPQAPGPAHLGGGPHPRPPRPISSGGAKPPPNSSKGPLSLLFPRFQKDCVPLHLSGVPPALSMSGAVREGPQ